MFIPRHPVIENQFCSYGNQAATGSAGVGGVVCYAGSVLWLDPAAVNEEPVVYKMAYSASPYTPFGFSMQKVKTGYHQVHPTGYFMPGDFGSSDVLAQPDYNSSGQITGTKSAPIGVAHLGIWDTVHYTCKMTASVIQAGDYMKPGNALYAAADEAKVTNNITNVAVGTPATDKANGSYCSTVQVGIVMKGASLAKCQANINNTTLYPIRMKILI
jgi:hypothetical protein